RVGVVARLAENFLTFDYDRIRPERRGPRPGARGRLLQSHPDRIRARRLAFFLRLVDVRGRHLETHPEPLEELAPARRCGAEHELHRAPSTGFGASRQPSVHSVE